MQRVALVVLVAWCALWASAPSAAATGGSLAGDVPVGGGLGLVVFGGGSVEDLEGAAAAQGCVLRAAYAPGADGFAGYLVGAPAFVNHDFEARFPGGLPARTPLVIACRAVPLATAASGQPRATVPSTEVIGVSLQGRPIEVTCHGEGERMLLLVGGLHTGPIEAVSAQLGREVAGALRTGTLAVPEGTRVCVIPVLNVDGLALGQRTNARGVDLNRNWPAASWSATAYHPEGGAVSGGTQPLSEPETRALYEYIVASRPAAVVVWHCCARMVEGNAAPGAAAMAARYASASGFDYIERWTDYPVSGQFIDGMDRLGVAAMDVELARSDETGRAQHLAGVAAVLRILEAAP